MSKKRKHQVTVGSLRATIYQWTHPRTGKAAWRFAWQDGERWRYRTAKTLDAAKIAAEKLLKEKVAGGLLWSGLAPARRRFLEDVERMVPVGEETAVLEFLRLRRAGGEIVEAVGRFCAWKEVEAGEETPHLVSVRKVLENLAEAFKGRAVASISGAELATWWEARGADCGPKRRKDLRAACAAFWKWCKREGLVGDGVTAAERLPTPKVGAGERRVLTVAELLAVAGEVRKEWRAWVALGAFCGLRPEEIAPANLKRGEKRGLRCEDIDWEFSVVRIAAEVSKVGRPRHVPLCDAAKEWLTWADIKEGMTGPVCLRNPSQAKELERVAARLFPGQGWPQDVLRHSFGSYRNGVLRNLGQVAEEMGTSETMLHRHYHNPRTKEEAAEWFAAVPPKVEAVDAAGWFHRNQIGTGDGKPLKIG